MRRFALYPKGNSAQDKAPLGVWGNFGNVYQKDSPLT